MAGTQQSTTVAPTRAPRLHVNLISVDPGRRGELYHRLEGDGRFTLAERSERADADRGIVALDVAGAEQHALELVRRLTRRPDGPAVLAVLGDEDDVELACAFVLAGAAGVASLRQPSSCLCQAVVDVAGGLPSLSPAIEAALVRRLQALPAD